MKKLIALAAISLMLTACGENPTSGDEIEIIETEVKTCDLYAYDGRLVKIPKCALAYLSGTNGWFDGDCAWHAGLELGCELAEEE